MVILTGGLGLLNFFDYEKENAKTTKEPTARTNQPY